AVAYAVVAGLGDGAPERRGRAPRMGSLLRRVPSPRELALLCVISLVLWATLFSSFFTTRAGPLDSLRALVPAGRVALHSEHEKAATYYIAEILVPYEPGLALGGCIGLALAVRRRDRLALGLGTWAVGVLALYSAIPYKTPWLVLNVLLPLALLAGR